MLYYLRRCRSYYLRHPKYDKPLLSKTYLRWKPGFHNTFPPPHIYHDMNLTLLHLTEVTNDCKNENTHTYTYTYTHTHTLYNMHLNVNSHPSLPPSPHSSTPPLL